MSILESGMATTQVAEAVVPADSSFGFDALGFKAAVTNLVN